MKKRIFGLVLLVSVFENEIRLWGSITGLFLICFFPVKHALAEDVEISECDKSCMLFVQEMIENRKALKRKPVPIPQGLPSLYKLPGVKIKKTIKIIYVNRVSGKRNTQAIL